MKTAARFILRLAQVAGIALLAMVAAVLLFEVVAYVGRSPEYAALRAAEQFKRECARYDLSEAEFSGPQFDGEGDFSYKFRWINSKTRAEILVLASYLPLGTEGWYTESTPDPAISPRFGGPR